MVRSARNANVLERSNYDSCCHACNSGFTPPGRCDRYGVGGVSCGSQIDVPRQVPARSEVEPRRTGSSGMNWRGRSVKADDVGAGDYAKFPQPEGKWQRRITSQGRQRFVAPRNPRSLSPLESAAASLDASTREV